MRFKIPFLSFDPAKAITKAISQFTRAIDKLNVSIEKMMDEYDANASKMRDLGKQNADLLNESSKARRIIARLEGIVNVEE